MNLTGGGGVQKTSATVVRSVRSFKDSSRCFSCCSGIILEYLQKFFRGVSWIFMDFSRSSLNIFYSRTAQRFRKFLKDFSRHFSRNSFMKYYKNFFKGFSRDWSKNCFWIFLGFSKFLQEFHQDFIHFFSWISSVISFLESSFGSFFLWRPS